MQKLFVYLQPDFAVDEAKFKHCQKKFKETIKNTLRWAKEHFNHQKEREKTNMVLGNVWLLPMVGKFLLEEELKEEKNYLYPRSWSTKNNDRIVFLK